jgi:ketosteroid isomerase-like protein
LLIFKNIAMTNKEIVRKVIEGFRVNDINAIMEHLTANVQLDMIGDFTTKGKDEFRKKHKPNEDDMEPGTMTILNEIEDGDTVAVEGILKCKMEDGTMYEASFSDFFKLENGKIKEMRFYVVPQKKPE